MVATRLAKTGVMITRVYCALALLVAAGGAAAAQNRIVSINLCADELLIALADPAQIVALSPFSVDRNLSFFADQAAAYRHDVATAEQVVETNPDLVLAGRFTKRATRAMLTRLGYQLVLLDPARSVAHSIDQIRQIAGIVGHADRGEELVAAIVAARDEAAARIQVTQATTAVIYQRRGYVTGGQTLSEELLEIAGFRNAGAELAGPIGGFVALERLVATPPDHLVVSRPGARAEDQGSALLAHPALSALFPPHRRIVLPERLTVCGGPSLPAAIRWLVGEAERLRTP